MSESCIPHCTRLPHFMLSSSQALLSSCCWLYLCPWWHLQQCANYNCRTFALATNVLPLYPFFLSLSRSPTLSSLLAIAYLWAACSLCLTSCCCSSLAGSSCVTCRLLHFDMFGLLLSDCTTPTLAVSTQPRTATKITLLINCGMCLWVAAVVAPLLSQRLLCMLCSSAH